MSASVATTAVTEETTAARHDLRLVPGALLAWGGAAWWVTQPSWVAVGAAVGGLLVAAVARARPWTAVSACLIALVAASCAWRIAEVEGSPVRAWAEEEVVADVVATVTLDARSYESLGGEGIVLGVSLDRVVSRLGVVRDGGDATVFVDGSGISEHDLVVGRQVALRAQLTPSDATNEVAAARAHAVEPLPGTPWWWAGGERVREGVRGAVAGQPAAPRGLVPALVDGDVSALPEELEEDFRRSGLTHLTAVSGANLVIIVAAVLGAVRAMGVGRRWWAVLGLLSVVGFVVVARPEPSVLRAAAMGVVGLVGLGVGRAAGVRSLAVAVVALLVVDPWLSRSPGFVLSVCATAGIVLWARPFAERLSWCPRWLAVSLAVPLAAQLACTPALVALSGEVSLVAVFANLLVAPAVAPTTVAGLAGGLAYLVWPWAGMVFGTVAGWCARWIILIGEIAGDFDGASVRWGGPWWLSVIALPVVVAALWWLLRRPGLAVGVAIGLMIVIWRPPDPGWPPEGWTLVACDVGQGDGLVVDAGEGRAVVVDTGMDPEPVDRCLRRLGVDQVTALVLTHADADHVAGWRGVARGRQVERVVVGPSGGPDDLSGLPVEQAAAGDVIEAGEATLEVLWPRDREAEPGDDRNDVSLVLRLRAGGVTTLLTGDIGPEAQRALLRSGVDVRADVLKVPHHGSKHQDEEFIAAVGAQAALLSAGRDNDYGHPAPSVLTLLGDLGTAWWRTDEQGDLAVVVEDGRFGVVARGVD
ncbi:MAG: DNA internalization-related competence protein ComEC/Rec2 [Aeromicrobium sp.]|uniref:DNA internalization-related competence protein ComEC/Rec2 n=1 Tax=Aeromicrobium sp. TaxID=1871063 RepID=UPI0039E3BAA0